MDNWWSDLVEGGTATLPAPAEGNWWSDLVVGKSESETPIAPSASPTGDPTEQLIGELQFQTDRWKSLGGPESDQHIRQLQGDIKALQQPGGSISDERRGFLGTIAATPETLLVDTKKGLGAITGQAVGASLDLLGFDEKADEFRGASRREVDDARRFAAKQANLDSGPLGSAIRQGIAAVGEAGIATLTGAGLPGLVSYYAGKSYSDAKAEGKSEAESLLHAAVEGAWTFAGGRLLGAGTGKLADTTIGRALNYTAKKSSLGRVVGKALGSAAGEVTQEVGTEINHYLTEWAFGKKWDSDELWQRIKAVLGPAVVAGGGARAVVEAITSRVQSLPKVAKAVADAEKLVKENPEAAAQIVAADKVPSRREFAEATGKTVTNGEYREVFTDTLRDINRQLTESEAEPPVDYEGPRQLEHPDTVKTYKRDAAKLRIPELTALFDSDPDAASRIFLEATQRAKDENEHHADLRQQFDEAVGSIIPDSAMNALRSRARRQAARGGDETNIPKWDLILDNLNENFPELASYANDLGLPQFLTSGKSLFAHVSPKHYAAKLLQEYENELQSQATEAEAPAPQQPAPQAPGGAEEQVDRLPFEPQAAFSGLPIVVNIDLGKAGKAIGRTTESAKRWLKQNFTTPGLRNEDIQRLDDRRVGTIAKQVKSLDQLQADLDRAIYGQYGRTRSVSPDLRAKMDAALKGEPVDLPAPILKAIEPMRAQIDALSEQFVKAGIGGEEFQGSVDENMGVYVTRTYRKFQDKHWAQRVKDDPQVMNAAKAALAAEFPDDSPSDIEWRISMLLDKDSLDAKGIPQKFHKDAKFQSILMQRKDLPEWLRNLYGENRDPWINHTLTVTKMAQLLAHNEFMRDVRQIGLEHGFFTEVDPREIGPPGEGEQRRPPTAKNPEHYRRVNATNNRLLEPLADLYTDPDTAQALEDLFSAKQMSRAYRWAVGASMLAKWNATVGNSKSYVRNFLGNPAFAMANGDLFSGDIRQSFKATLANLTTQKDAGLRKYLQRLAELRVLDSDISVAEIKAMMGDLADSGEMPNLTTGGIRRAIGRGVKFLNTLYQSMDTFWKVNAFEAKTKYYSQLHPEMAQSEIEQLAAEDVRAHYPTYSEVPAGVKAVNRFPGLGNFLSFRSEVIRNTKNVIKTGLREVQSANPIERAMGRKRLLGLAASAATLSIISEASKMIFGVSDDEDKNVRLFQAPWTRNSPYLYLSPINDGAPNTIDLGFMDPRAQFTKPIYALLGPGTTEEKIEQAFREAFDPLREDILFGRVFAAFYNKTVDGREVYNESAGTLEKMRRIRDYVGEPLLPGTISQIGRIRKGFEGEVSASGRTYDPVVELAGAVGIRATPVDVRTSLFYRSNDLRRSVRDAEAGIRTALLRRGTVGKEETQRVITDFMAQREKYVRQWHELAMAAIRLGVPAGEVGKTVYNAASSQALTTQIMSGTYAPYQPSEETIRDALATPQGGERVGAFRALTPAPPPTGN